MLVGAGLRWYPGIGLSIGQKKGGGSHTTAASFNNHSLDSCWQRTGFSLEVVLYEVSLGHYGDHVSVAESSGDEASSLITRAMACGLS